jgi:two-component system, OmpR family, sensor kinase
MSLRVRSIAAAAAATLIAVIVLGLAVDVLVARHLHHAQDNTLRARAVEVAQLAASAPALLTTPGSLDSPVGAAQAVVEIVDRHGRIAARSLSLRGRVLPPSLAAGAIAKGRGGYRTVEFDNDTLRVYAAPLANVAGPVGGGAVIVGVSTSDVGDTIRSLHLVTILSALGAAALGALVLAFLMRGALRPLSDLAQGAGEIERTGDPRRRLPEPRREDEVGRLAATLNRMLGSLERARENERRFLADASHELRTPLTALRGNVEHLARHGATSDLIADLEADADRLARLADDLLAVSREETAPAPEAEVRLDEVARRFAADDVEVRTEPAVVRGEPAALERAVSNLVDNARRHGPAGRLVTVTVDVAGDRARLSVADQGAGPVDPEHAFERFWRGNSGAPGSGLGLAIVRATAERHGGRATVQGSRFTIDLPVLRKLSENDGNLQGGTLEKGPS